MENGARTSPIEIPQRQCNIVWIGGTNQRPRIGDTWLGLQCGQSVYRMQSGLNWPQCIGPGRIWLGCPDVPCNRTDIGGRTDIPMYTRDSNGTCNKVLDVAVKNWTWASSVMWLPRSAMHFYVALLEPNSTLWDVAVPLYPSSRVLCSVPGATLKKRQTN